MKDKELLEKLKEDLETTIGDNYHQLLGFLQRLYAVNVVREFISQDDSLKDEAPIVVKSYLEELYNSESAKKYIFGLSNISDEKSIMETTSSVLMETVFPEFLDGRFNPNVLNPQIRKIVSKLFISSEAFKNSSKKFKKGFKSAMKRERETDRTGYGEAKISSELNELLYEDSKDNCWCYQKKVDII